MIESFHDDFLVILFCLLVLLQDVLNQRYHHLLIPLMPLFSASFFPEVPLTIHDIVVPRHVADLDVCAPPNVGRTLIVFNIYATGLFIFPMQS